MPSNKFKSRRRSPQAVHAEMLERLKLSHLFQGNDPFSGRFFDGLLASFPLDDASAVSRRASDLELTRAVKSGALDDEIALLATSDPAAAKEMLEVIKLMCLTNPVRARMKRYDHYGKVVQKALGIYSEDDRSLEPSNIVI
ncbi:hypothetical protein GN316_19415 [Xylophilus sp. Kf1]|nr:hypothetical protein [Xylophilus sp. Kf1]